MNNFVVNFDLKKWEELDSIVLNMQQENNLGNKNDWFGYWRGGLFSFYRGIYGTKLNYDTLHAWLPYITNKEYCLASCFFNMDSSVECLTFALNSLGYALSNEYFYDISNETKLKKLTPKILSEKQEIKTQTIDHC